MHNRIFEFTTNKRTVAERYDARKDLPGSFLDNSKISSCDIVPENERSEALEWLDDQIMNYCTNSDCVDETFVFSKNNAKMFVKNIFNKYKQTLQKMLDVSMEDFSTNAAIITIPKFPTAVNETTAADFVKIFANGAEHGIYIIYEDELMTLNNFMKKLYSETPEGDIKRFYVGSIYEYRF